MGVQVMGETIERSVAMDAKTENKAPSHPNYGFWFRTGRCRCVNDAPPDTAQSRFEQALKPA